MESQTLLQELHKKIEHTIPFKCRDACNCHSHERNQAGIHEAFTAVKSIADELGVKLQAIYEDFAATIFPGLWIDEHNNIGFVNQHEASNRKCGSINHLLICIDIAAKIPPDNAHYYTKKRQPS